MDIANAATAELEKFAGEAASAVIEHEAQKEITQVASAVTNTNDSHTKIWLKILAGMAVVVVLVGVAFGGYYLYNEYRASQQSQNITDLKNNVGALTTQAQVLQQENKDVIAEQARIAALTNTLNGQLAKTRQKAVQQEQAVQNYQADQIAVDHPEQVEQWANNEIKTNFDDIEQETKHAPSNP